jgi:hypothetical protein
MKTKTCHKHLLEQKMQVSMYLEGSFFSMVNNFATIKNKYTKTAMKL